MGKRKYNPLNNLLGFVNLSNKKRKVAKASCNKKSSKRKLGKENVRLLVHILLIISLIIVCRHNRRAAYLLLRTRSPKTDQTWISMETPSRNLQFQMAVTVYLLLFFGPSSLLGHLWKTSAPNQT